MEFMGKGLDTSRAPDLSSRLIQGKPSESYLLSQLFQAPITTL